MSLPPLSIPKPVHSAAHALIRGRNYVRAEGRDAVIERLREGGTAPWDQTVRYTIWLGGGVKSTGGGTRENKGRGKQVTQPMEAYVRLMMAHAQTTYDKGKGPCIAHGHSLHGGSTDGECLGRWWLFGDFDDLDEQAAYRMMAVLDSIGCAYVVSRKANGKFHVELPLAAMIEVPTITAREPSKTDPDFDAAAAEWKGQVLRLHLFKERYKQELGWLLGILSELAELPVNYVHDGKQSVSHLGLDAAVTRLLQVRYTCTKRAPEDPPPEVHCAIGERALAWSGAVAATGFTFVEQTARPKRDQGAKADGRADGADDADDPFVDPDEADAVTGSVPDHDHDYLFDEFVDEWWIAAFRHERWLFSEKVGKFNVRCPWDDGKSTDDGAAILWANGNFFCSFGSCETRKNDEVFDALSDEGKRIVIDGTEARVRADPRRAFARYLIEYAARIGTVNVAQFGEIRAAVERGGADVAKWTSQVRYARRRQSDVNWAHVADLLLAVLARDGSRSFFSPNCIDLAADLKARSMPDFIHVREQVSKRHLVRDWNSMIAQSELQLATAGGASDVAGSGTGQPDTLLSTLLAQSELVRNADGDPFALIKVGGHREVWALDTTNAERWIAGVAYRKFNRSMHANEVKEHRDTLAAIAVNDGKLVDINTRVALHEGRVYLDLADESWRAVEIDAEGWRVVSQPPVYFRRSRGMLSLPEPSVNGSLDEIWRFVNVAERDRVLVLAWLIAALYPRGPFPVLAFAGEQGSAKSYSTRALRRFVDPNKAPLRALPKSDQDLLIAARHSRILGYDNVSGIPAWLADAFCSLATGAGHSTRTLYSNADEVILEAARPILLNGIGDITSRSDLLDRTLVINPPKITSENRRTEDDLDRELTDAHPRILGALLDVVSRALRERDHVTLKELPRMADFAKLAVAAAPAMGFTSEEFLEAHKNNRGEGHGAVLEGSVIVSPLRRFLATKQGSWKGTMGGLLECLTSFANEAEKRSFAWPGTPRKLRSDLDRISPDLATIGITLAYSIEGHEKDRMVTVTQKAVPPPPPSASSAGPSAHGTAGTPRRPDDSRNTPCSADDADGCSPSAEQNI